MMGFTVEDLIRILERQPKDTKILIENSDGSSSELLEEDGVLGYWERAVKNSEGRVKETETVMMFLTGE